MERIKKLTEQYPDLELREILKKAFDFSNDFSDPQPFNLILEQIALQLDLTMDAARNPPTHAEEAFRKSQLYEQARSSQVGQSLLKQFQVPTITELVGGVQNITVPFEMMNTETGAVVRGSVIENLEKNIIQLTPVSSSNVRAAGQFGSELLVQFIPKGLTPLRTYRYEFETPEAAKEAYTSITTSGSPGRWVWQNIRGHTAGEKVSTSKLGPSLKPPGQGLPTIGGTIKSLVPYSISNRVPVTRVGNFNEMQKQLQRTFPNLTRDPMVGTRVEAKLGAQKGFRELGLRPSTVLGQLPKLDFVFVGNANDLELTTDYAFNFNPAELKLIVESLESLVRNEEDPFFAATAKNIIEQIESRSTGKFETVEISAMQTREQIEEEYGQQKILKSIVENIHDDIISLVPIGAVSEEMEEETDHILNPETPLVLEDVIEFSFGMLFNHFKPEEYGEPSEQAYRERFNKIIEEDNLSGFLDLFTDKLLFLGEKRGESKEWKDSVKETYNKLKKGKKEGIGMGKGWWRDPERHSRARKFGKADMTADSLEECVNYYKKEGKSEEESKRICFAAINKKETESTEKAKQPYKEGKYYDISTLKRKLKWGERVRLEYIKDGVETFPKKFLEKAHPDIVISETIPDYYPERKGKIPLYYQQVGIDVTYDYVSGSYDPNQNRCIVSLTNMGSKNDVIGTIRHELAHAVWEYGKTPINLKYDLSDRLQGWKSHIGNKYYHIETEMFALLFETQGELKKFMNRAKIDSVVCAQEFITVYERFLKWAGVKINE